GWAMGGSGANFGVHGQTDSSAGTAVYGQSTATTGVTAGVAGTVSSPDGWGVYGSTRTSTGVCYGVVGVSGSTSGRGVIGEEQASTGATYGVLGIATSPSGFGVYSSGNMGASGTKPFRIDHPFDPANKYLLHYASESPMPQNFYTGNIVTDERGYAMVELP